MSSTPPPGWYRDPKAPHLERWWDGTAWTEHRRTPEPSGPPVPGPPSAGDAAGRRSRIVALTAAGAVLVTAVVTGTLVLGEDDGAEVTTAPTLAASEPTSHEPTPDTPTPTPTPSQSTSEPSADDPAVVVDQLNGITLPLLTGWVRPRSPAEADVLMTTDGTYDCPADFGLCRHGKVISRTASADDGTSPETLAKADIQDAADDAYGRDRVGRRPFGGIKSHQVVKSGPAQVAGRAGYFVRWRVRTAEGPGGYVQSLAFPSRVGTEAPVIVRYVFDAGEDGPPLTDMDRLTEGIRSTSD